MAPPPDVKKLVTEKVVFRESLPQPGVDGTTAGLGITGAANGLTPVLPPPYGSSCSVSSAVSSVATATTTLAALTVTSAGLHETWSARPSATCEQERPDRVAVPEPV